MAELKTDFKDLLDKKDWTAVTHRLDDMDPIEISHAMEDVLDDDQTLLFMLLRRNQAKEVFQHLPHARQAQIIEDLAQNIERKTNLLNDIEPDDRTAFFEDLPGETIQGLIQTLSPKERDISLRLLGYPKDSIGRLMTPEYVAIRPENTIDQAFHNIRKHGRDSETLNVIYIVDHEGKLVDDIRIRELILAAPGQKVEELMDRRFTALNAMDDQETAIKTFMDYDRVAMPVVNGEGVLLGIVTIDDILDIAEEETTEDFHKFGAFQAAISDPVKERIFSLYKNRVVWLVALVFMNIFSGAALASFEYTIQAVVSLVFFLPLLIDSGGNAGSQSATLMIRSLAMGDVKATDWYKMIGKEVLVSLLLGITMAAAVSAVAWYRAPEIVAVVAVTMVITVMIGSLIGMMLPFLFTKLKLDPATASAPLITSISDICGVLVYFSIAAWYFGH